MHYNIHTQRITNAPVNAKGQIVSTQDDLPSMGIYPLAQNQPAQQKFQIEVFPLQIEEGYAVRKYQDIPLNEAKQQLIAEIKNVRESKELIGFEWVDENGQTWIQDTSPTSQLKIQSCIHSEFDDYWFFMNGDRLMNAVQLTEVLSVGMQYVRALFQKQKMKNNAVSELKSIEECRNFDVNAGW